jgi:gliding motility-associated lipoprotein GldH
LECPLADQLGNWYGSGLGSIFDNRVLFRERKKFPLSGHYKVDIHQAMRTDALEGIYDVGFRLATP